MNTALAKSPRQPTPVLLFAPLYCSRERIIVLFGVHWNLCLRDANDAIYGPADPDGHVEFIAHRDALFLSCSPDLPAVRTGIWPKGAK